MKLLFDQNISPRILRYIGTVFPGSTHIRFCGLEDAGDHLIFEFAKSNELTIVTFDTDFIDLSIVKGSPPKIIILRTGNMTTKAISKFLKNNIRNIQEFHKSKEIEILEIVVS